MTDHAALKKKVEELAERVWDGSAIEARVKKLSTEGIPKKKLSSKELLADKQQIIDRVQRRAEEYNFIARNCARSSALAVMEEFGFGNLEIIKALTPFPGFGGTGWMCGGVTGGLIALGLYFGRDDLLDFEAAGATFMAARKFMTRFEGTVGAVLCPKIQEEVVFGRYMDPGASLENMEAFIKAKGIEKCSLLPGIGARLAAEIIVESLE
ncbi:MAG: C_GCAxxG_C_C family protein [Deltaproteobacteria bacterium]|nr:C_GCAxxG_C_C family protein [Deltaproteobacteria bacterium]